MIQTPSSMMRDLVQKTLDQAGFTLTVSEDDLLYGVPVEYAEYHNSEVSVEIINQPIAGRGILLRYNRLDLTLLTTGLASFMRVDALPPTVYDTLPYLSQYLRIQLGPDDVEDGEIIRIGNAAVISLIAKAGSLVVIGATDVAVEELASASRNVPWTM